MTSLRAWLAVIFLLVSSTQAWASFGPLQAVAAAASSAAEAVGEAVTPACPSHPPGDSMPLVVDVHQHDAMHDCGCPDVCLCATACASGCAVSASLLGAHGGLIVPQQARSRLATTSLSLASAHRGDPFRPPAAATTRIVAAPILIGH
jgi:hypothetical protein